MKIQNINNISFSSEGRMSTKIKEALTKDDDFVLKKYYDDIKDIKPLTRNEERKLAKQITEGGEIAEKAWETLIVSALPMVVYVTRYLCGRKMEFADMIQEGNIALMNMPYLRNYDGKSNSRQGIYPYISPKILRAIENKADLIRVPIDVRENSRKIKKAENELELRLKRPAKEKEIADFLHISEKVVSTAKKVNNTFVSFTEEIIKEIDDDNFKRMGLPECCAQKNLDLEQLSKDLRIHLEKLSPVKRDVIIKRFGLFGTKVYSVSEIAKEKNLSTSRINMIIQESLRRLRRNNIIKEMPDLTVYMA